MRQREVLGLVAGAVVWPLAVRAQNAGRYRVPYLAFSGEDDGGYALVFAARLRELGLIEGQNLTLIYRSAEGHADRLPGLAAELLQSGPHILVAGLGTLTAQAAKRATPTVPVVFANVGDPLGAGLVSNLARPGGNATGLSSQSSDIGGKRLQLFRELIPTTKSVAALFNPESPFSAAAMRELRPAGNVATIVIHALEAKSAEEIPARFATAAQAGVTGLIVLDDPLFTSLRDELCRLAAAHRLPALFGDRLFAEAGGLVAYGPDRRANFRRAADYVEKTLKGATPADLPVEQSTKFDLVLNLRTAKALGLTIPPTLLARADEVIE